MVTVHVLTTSDLVFFSEMTYVLLSACFESFFLNPLVTPPPPLPPDISPPKTPDEIV